MISTQLTNIIHNTGFYCTLFQKCSRSRVGFLLPEILLLMFSDAFKCAGDRSGGSAEKMLLNAAPGGCLCMFYAS